MEVCRTARWCVLLAAVGCGRIGFDKNVDADVPPGTFVIGGTVTGLATGGLVLLDNGGDALPRASDGPFQFSTPIADGGAYDVTVGAMPPGQACIVANGSGTVAGAAITDVAVACFAAGTCPKSALTFVTTGMFAMPAGCTAMTVEAHGGGGAGGVRGIHNDIPAAGGNGGRAVRSFTGIAPGTMFVITIGRGGRCESTAASIGGYAGGGGGIAGGSGSGGSGAGAAPGGTGGFGAGTTQPGGSGGTAGYGGGGGGGGGDVRAGNSAGGATTMKLASPVTDYVCAGGGGGAGAADQDTDVAGAGGAACNGYGGANGGDAAGARAGGGGGGGACYCLGGTCDSSPTPAGGAGGSGGMTLAACSGAQNGTDGRVTITFP